MSSSARPSRFSSLFSAYTRPQPNPPLRPANPAPTSRQPIRLPPPSLPRPSPPAPMSPFSSPPVPDAGWSSENFMLGAGMVIIQPSTNRVVVLYDTEQKYWFLPKGRKDQGESLEETAVREAFEESGYRVTPLPLYAPTRAPSPPPTAPSPLATTSPITPTPSSSSSSSASFVRLTAPALPRKKYKRNPTLNTEPVYTSITHWNAGRGNRSVPGEYLTFWYVGQIGKDAVPIKNSTSQHDEQSYTTYLLTYAEAVDMLFEHQRTVLQYVWAVYMDTLRIMAENGQVVDPDRELD